MIKIISFDMDGTLVNEDFDDKIWMEELPRKYAETKNIPFEEAKEYVYSEYEIYKENNNWSSLEFWFNRFGMENWKEIIEKNTNLIEVYPETVEVIKELKKKFKIIIITQAPREFIDVKLKDIEHLFDSVYSSTHHFNSLKKDQIIYKKILDDMGIGPEEIIHVGDHRNYDYDAPRSIGIKSFLLDRKGKYVDMEIVKDLKEFMQKIQAKDI